MLSARASSVVGGCFVSMPPIEVLQDLPPVMPHALRASCALPVGHRLTTSPAIVHTFEIVTALLRTCFCGVCGSCRTCLSNGSACVPFLRNQVRFAAADWLFDHIFKPEALKPILLDVDVVHDRVVVSGMGALGTTLVTYLAVLPLPVS